MLCTMSITREFTPLLRLARFFNLFSGLLHSLWLMNSMHIRIIYELLCFQKTERYLMVVSFVILLTAIIRVPVCFVHLLVGI